MCAFGELNKVFIGWVLGLGSAILVEMYRRMDQRERFRKAVNAELAEMKVTLVGALTSLHMASGKTKRVDIEMCRDLQKKYAIATDSDSINKALESLLALDAQAFERGVEAYAKINSNLGQVVPKLHLPYLSSSPGLISLLQEEEQKSLVRILVLLERSNGKIDEMNYWLRETFRAGPSFDSATKNFLSSREALIVSMKRLMKIAEAIEFEN